MSTVTAPPTSPTQAPPEKKSGGFRDLGMMFGGGQSTIRQFGILIALVVIIGFFQIFTGGKTLESGNVINILNANTYVLILAIGMVMVIIAGHIDLSVGSVAAFTGIVVAIAINRWDFPTPLAILFGLLVGALIGAWQGFWVAYVGIPAFIVTLAGMLLFRGANQFVGNSTTEPVNDPVFQALGGGYLPDFGPSTGYSNPTLLLGLLAIVAVVVGEVIQRRRERAMGSEQAPLWVSIVKLVILALIIGAATQLFGSGRAGTSFPIPGLILVVLVIVYSFMMKSTVFGRHIYAVGGNWHAAELSGVNIRRVNFLVMMNMSILAAIAGMIFVARSRASGPGDGVGWELDAIAAVFIGGAAVSGGIGTVIGSIVGGLVIAVLNNGLQLLGVGADRVQMIKGIVLLLAVAIDVLSKKGTISAAFTRFGGGRREAAGLPVNQNQPVDRPSVDPTGTDTTSRPQSTMPNP